MKKTKPIESSELVGRIADSLVPKTDFEQKYMFGGVCFMVNDKMCVGVTNKDELMIRIDPIKEEEALQKNGAREMDFTGRKMKGFILVSQENIASKKELDYFINLALDYNKIAKKSKPKK